MRYEPIWSHISHGQRKSSYPQGWDGGRRVRLVRCARGDFDAAASSAGRVGSRAPRADASAPPPANMWRPIDTADSAFGSASDWRTAPRAAPSTVGAFSSSGSGGMSARAAANQKAGELHRLENSAVTLQQRVGMGGARAAAASWRVPAAARRPPPSAHQPNCVSAPAPASAIQSEEAPTTTTAHAPSHQHPRPLPSRQPPCRTRRSGRRQLQFGPRKVARCPRATTTRRTTPLLKRPRTTASGSLIAELRRRLQAGPPTQVSDRQAFSPRRFGAFGSQRSPTSVDHRAASLANGLNHAVRRCFIRAAGAAAKI